MYIYFLKDGYVLFDLAKKAKGNKYKKKTKIEKKMKWLFDYLKGEKIEERKNKKNDTNKFFWNR